MKNKSILAVSIICFFLALFGLSVKAKIDDNGCSGEVIKRIDSLGETDLPKRFRIDKELGISGSSQFTKEQIKNIKDAIGKENIIDVDLRQESHGFLNNIAFSYHKVNGIINKGLSSKEVIKAENEFLSEIKIGSEATLCKNEGEPVLKLTANYVSSEEDAVIKERITYKRLAVMDGNIPTPEVVDDFVELVKNQPIDSYIHFHCEEGKGRTTTFMVMYSMIKNYDKKTLEEILVSQVDLGGININRLPKRAEYIMHFYNYCKEVGPTGFKTSYSTYIKEKNLPF